jgi:hypothetical protein
MRNIKPIVVFAALLLLTNLAAAQSTQYDTAKQAPQSIVTEKETNSNVVAAANHEPEMADRMRADGKIYVVVAIILVILTGFVLYLVFLDRKVRKLEALLSEKKV